MESEGEVLGREAKNCGHWTGDEGLRLRPLTPKFDGAAQAFLKIDMRHGAQ